MSYLRKVGAIIRKDLQGELRSKEVFTSMLTYALMVMIVFAFAFNPLRETTRQVFPGMIWVAISFAGVLGLNRSFTSELQNETLTGLILAPLDRSAIYLAKVIDNLLLLVAVELITVPMFFIFFDYHSQGPVWQMVPVLALGSMGFVAVGTLLAALSANTRSSEMLLPLILFPVLVPVLIGAVQATGLVLAGEGLGGTALTWLRVLIVYDIVFLVIPFILFDYLLEV